MHQVGLGDDPDAAAALVDRPGRRAARARACTAQHRARSGPPDTTAGTSVVHDVAHGQRHGGASLGAERRGQRARSRPRRSRRPARAARRRSAPRARARRRRRRRRGRRGRPLASIAPITPESTSPVPGGGERRARAPREIATRPVGRGDQRVVALEHDERLRAWRPPRARGAAGARSTSSESTSSSRPSSPACGVSTVGQRRCGSRSSRCAGERVEPVGVDHQRHVDALRPARARAPARPGPCDRAPGRARPRRRGRSPSAPARPPRASSAPVRPRAARPSSPRAASP